MHRLLQTSSGWVLVDIGHVKRVGNSITVTPFDGEGWETQGKMWSERYGYHEPNEKLPEFLARALSIPAAEADALAASMEGPMRAEWERRGGVSESEEVARWSRAVVAGAAGLMAFAVLGLVLLVWVIVT